MRIGVGRKKIRIGDLLVAAGAITDEQLNEALQVQKEEGGKLGSTLVKLDFISQELLNATLTQQLGIDFIELKACKLEDEVLRLIPESLVLKHRAIPIEFDEMNPNLLKVAMSDPMDIIAIDDISIITGMQIEPMLTTDEEINEAIGKYYGNQQAMEAAEQFRLERESDQTDEEDSADNEDINNSPIVLPLSNIS